MKILEKDPPLAEDCKRPWILVSLLYPFSHTGLMHIAMYMFCPTLLILSYRILFSQLPIGVVIYIVAFTLFIGYGIYYISFCVFDSTKSQTKARKIPEMYFPDKSELVYQYILILGSAAICFFPAVIYYFFVRQTDYIFWILSGSGLFFFPMALLSAILFDGINELSPIFLGASIFKVLTGYIKLCLFFFTVAGFILFISICGIFPGFIIHGISFYLSLVLANRLGWFYWWHRDKLRWGI